MRARVLGRVIASIGLIALAACSSPVAPRGTTGSGGSGSCAFTARFDGQTYVGIGGLHRMPTLGRPLGTAILPACEDVKAASIPAFAVRGLDPRIVFASPRFEQMVLVREDVDPIPAAIRRLEAEPTCVARGGSIELRGPWLGILGADGKTEVDMVPPYDLSMRVDDATPVRYERTFLTVRVEAGRPLDQADLRSSLWKGGQLIVHASCLGGRFVADTVTALAPASAAG
jgi:Family of unknown function (DUF6281)